MGYINASVQNQGVTNNTVRGSASEPQWARSKKPYGISWPRPSFAERGEQQLLGHLIQWESEHNYTNDSPDTVRKKAIQLHVDRIFDNPRWVDFVSFNCRFRPEALEDAHLVTVINECCQEPGVVTQEQIDASANGTVACPCCGRWSPFRVIEQAIQTESAAGQTEEAKGGMHLC